VGRTRRPDGDPSRVQTAVTDPDVAALIEGLRGMRRTLDTDLTTAAAALEDDRPEIAGDIVDGALADVAAFRAAAIARLDAEEASRQPHAIIPARPRPGRVSSRRSRALIAIPAIPLVGALAMGAAAAIGDFSTPTHHHQAPAATKAITRPHLRPSATPTAASSTLARLERVVAHHPQSAQVLAVADDLHKQLTHIITTSSHNPNKLDVVSQLLNVEQQVLKNNHAPGTSIALAASRQVSQLLNQTSGPVLSLKNPIAPPAPPASSTATTKTTSTTSNKSHHSTSNSTKHHKRSTHRKHKTHVTTPTPKPSDPIFGSGVFGVLS